MASATALPVLSCRGAENEVEMVVFHSLIPKKLRTNLYVTLGQMHQNALQT